MSWVVLAQIVVAALLGAAIGVEREISAQPAGLRTHMLVSLGAALFTLAGTEVIGTDPTRVAAQVVAGIGFLAGGAILREGATTRGLTTAASLWVTAAIGLAVGLRAWWPAVFTTVLALVVLSLIGLVEREFLPRQRLLDVTLTIDSAAHIDQVERAVRAMLPRSGVLRLTYSGAGQALVLRAKPASGESLSAIGEHLRAVPGVVGVELSR